MKKYNIDGLPGFTMPGKKGRTGERGCMTFCNVMNSYNITDKYEYSIGLVFNSDDDTISPVVFPSHKVVPIIGDYVIDVLQTVSNLYVINNIYSFSKQLLEESINKNYDDALFEELTEDELVNLQIITSINKKVKDFEYFVSTLQDDFIYNVFELSLINTWLYNSNKLDKDAAITVSTQSCDIYRNSWKGEYTPKYLKREISYLSSPYTPFAHIKYDEDSKTYNLIDDRFQVTSAVFSEGINNSFIRDYPFLYRYEYSTSDGVKTVGNSASFTKYYIDMFNFKVNSLGYIYNILTDDFNEIDDPEKKFNPWISVQDFRPDPTSGDYICVNQFNTENDHVGNIIATPIKISKSFDIYDVGISEVFNNLSILDTDKSDLSILNIVKNINATYPLKNVDNIYLDENFPSRNEIVDAIGDDIIVITSDKGNNRDINHYLYFLKVKLYNSIEFEEYEDEEEQVTKKRHKSLIVNTNKVSMRSDGTFTTEELENLSDNVDFLHDSLINKNVKKVNAKVFLGKNIFNDGLVDFNDFNAETPINSKYNITYIKKSVDETKDLYTFNTNTVNVYDTSLNIKYKNKTIKFNNLTQCVEIKGLETDDEGEILIPIISTKPIIDGNKEENVFAFIQLSYNDGTSKYIYHKFFKNTTLINKIFYNDNNKVLSCYLLPRNFNQIIGDENIFGAVLDTKNNRYILKENSTWNDVKNTGEIPMGGYFKVISDDIVYYDTNSPSLIEKSNKLLKYNILTGNFDKVSGISEDEIAFENEDENEDEINDIEELINYHNNIVAEPEKYSLTQFIIESSLDNDTLQNMKIEIEVSNNSSEIVKNVSSCVDEMWDTKNYTQDNIDLKNITLGKNYILEIMYDLYMKNAQECSDNTVSRDAYFSQMNFDNIVDSSYLYSRLGLSKNYNNTLNFDDENILPCTFVIKNYGEEFNNGIYATSILIPKKIVNSSYIKMYLYNKVNSSSSTKFLLGETKLADTY